MSGKGANLSQLNPMSTVSMKVRHSEVEARITGKLKTE
jgi:hypothetical protein